MKLNIKEDIVVRIATLFYMCSILGYVYELILTYFHDNKIYSHGILNGPWLPIYGTGSLIIMMFYKYKKKPLVIFLLSFFITGIFEYLCGLVLLKFLKKRLWDYTGYFLNINGLVCFLSAFCFAIGGLLIVYLIYPLVEKIYNKVNHKFLKIILTILSIVFLGDIIATIIK